MPALPEERRKSHTFESLSVRPVDFSLTSGTNIPAPLDSPPVSLSPVESVRLSRPKTLSRPPTAGGGPLSSHPTNDIMPMPGALPPTPEPERENNTNHTDTTMHSEESNRDGAASWRSPTPNTNISQTSPGRRPGGVRRLFGLTSLRQSFSSSRTSFSIPPPSSSYGEQSTMQRPQSPGVMSTTASFMPPPSMHSNQQATLRKKRSSNWFKRKSGFFTTNENGFLDVVSEDPRPDSKRAKRSDLPMLPEISTLSGDSVGEGSIGWDEGLFKQ
ncbi:uncharacterized protein CLAFUR5_10261 [Fulvia fulva]|uniref:Uncharacterized protein n=1 Tax=Passalora fulva TaxID=5499 RepID=A0A9Q8URI1_PASFU|nr:uncharacterized protein CLAFUR5_10261 [Fulvia fulva]UJO19763.1 hypothetical protein CLAFUR5_10261 [Fulvia fulva]